MKGLYMKSLITSARFLGCGLIAAGLLVSSSVQAADTPGSKETTKGAGASKLSGNNESELSMSSDPASFVKEAVQGNTAEIAVAEVAQRKAQNAQVRQF